MSRNVEQPSGRQSVDDNLDCFNQTKYQVPIEGYNFAANGMHLEPKKIHKRKIFHRRIADHHSFVFTVVTLLQMLLITIDRFIAIDISISIDISVSLMQERTIYPPFII